MSFKRERFHSVLHLAQPVSSASAGDTHGLVNDDWKTLRWDKIAYLQRLKLKPWYISGSPASIESYPDSPANPPPSSSIPPPPPAIFATTPPTAPYVYADPALGTTFTNAPAPPPPSNAGSVEDGDGQATLIPLTTRGSQIIGVDGQTLLVKGVSWHGFDNGTYLQGFLRVGCSICSRVLNLLLLAPPAWMISLSMSSWQYFRH